MRIRVERIPMMVPKKKKRSLGESMDVGRERTVLERVSPRYNFIPFPESQKEEEKNVQE